MWLRPNKKTLKRWGIIRWDYTVDEWIVVKRKCKGCNVKFIPLRFHQKYHTEYCGKKHKRKKAVKLLLQDFK